MMMVLMKVARQMNDPLMMDNYVDMCGYAANGGEVAQEEAMMES